MVSKHSGIPPSPLLAKLTIAIPASYAALSLDGTRKLAAYALCTDADLRTLYAAAYTQEDGEQFQDRRFMFLPADWPLEDASEEMNNASDALSSWMDDQYEIEGSEVGPGDDHLRPWKREVFEAIVGLLASFQLTGIAPANMPLWLTCHDPNNEMVHWIRNGVKQLNEPANFSRWEEAWAYWCQ